MNIKIYAVAIFFLTTGLIKAEISYQAPPTICADYIKGTLTFKNGKTKDTYIFIDNCNPHLFQSGLRTIDAKTYKKYKKGKKIKRKAIEKFKTKQIKGFALENGRVFKQVKYVDLSATTKVGMLPKRFLLEVVADGDLTIYRKFYRTDFGIIHGPVMDSRLKGGPEHIEFMTSNFELLFQKDKTKNPRNIRNTHLKKLFAENAEVIKRFVDNEYVFRTEFQRKPTFGTNCDIPFMEALLEMVNDYNGQTKDGYTETVFEN